MMSVPLNDVCFVCPINREKMYHDIYALVWVD